MAGSAVRLDERWVPLVAVGAGVVAAASTASPTGRAATDALITGLAVAAVVFLAGRASWWIVAASAGAALCVALDPVLMVVALVGLAVALWCGATARVEPVALAASAGISLNVLARAELGGFLGLTALVAIVAGAAMFVSGLDRQTRVVKRVVWTSAGVVAVLAAVATVSFGLAAFGAKDDLAAGVRSAEQGVSELEQGLFTEAAGSFAAAAASLEQANEQLSGPLALPATLVPIVAQHRSAAVDMSDAGGSGAAIVADALDEIDLDALRTVDGQFDLDELTALRQPFARVRNAMLELSEVTARSLESPWLVNRAVVELEDFRVSIEDHMPDLDNAEDALALLPAMLGAESPQHYLVLFTTPSESRGLGGFVGSYAELTADGGRLSLSGFGRAQDLDAAVVAAEATIAGPEEFLARYGRFGFDEDGSGLVGDSAFRNLTMTPNFPWVGAIAADLYEQATGRPVDGVIALDPFVVAALLRYTGPIEVSSLDQPLDVDNAASYLLREQYVIGADDNTERTDALAEAAQLTLEALLAGSLPEPTTLARDLGPLAAECRVMIWSPQEPEQGLFERVDVAGAIPPLDGRDGWSFTVTNSAGNKIDSFLERRAAYEADVDDDGRTTATLRVELTNTAPAEGLPRYVIGNRAGLPDGTSRLYVSFYTALPLTGMTLDGAPSGVEVGEEAGWYVYSRFVDIPAGASVTFELQLEGSVARPEDVVTWEQPMATDVQPLE